MPVRRATGSDRLAQQAEAGRSSGVVMMRREARAHMANSMQARLADERSWSMGHEEDSDQAPSSLLEHDFANDGRRLGRPHFARLHASLAEGPLDWAWQHPPDLAKASGRSPPRAGGPAGTGLSTRALWCGGIAFALLAAGVISAVATVQSSRPLPFDTWGRPDLLPPADGMPGATTTPARRGNQLAGGPEGALWAEPGSPARHEVLAALAGVIAAREPVEADAALASDTAPEPSQVEVAGLGPVLASAAAAEQVAGNVAILPLTTAGVGAEIQRRLAEPPRPVFKPVRASFQPNEPAPSPSRP